MARNARRQLARRLRELREFELGEKLTQDGLAAALSERRRLSGAAVSTWENGESDKRPSDERIVQYALLFSTPDNLKPAPHVPTESSLDKSAREHFYALRRELARLRDEAEQEARRERTPSPARSIDNEMWQHDRNEEIVVVTSEVPEDELPPNARAGSVNYTRLARYGHIDSFFEMYMRIAELGYRNRRHRSANDRGIDPASTLVLIGGPSDNRMTRNVMRLLHLPFSQHIVHDDGPESFLLDSGSEGTELGPVMADFEDGERELIEDVGLFLRASNPTNPAVDITLCSGCHPAGVLGAVRSFTHPDVVADNVETIRAEVGRLTDFFVLFRVPVVNGRVPPQRLKHTLIRAEGIGATKNGSRNGSR